MTGSDFALQTTWRNPDQAKASISQQLGPYCRDLWKQGIDEIMVVLQPAEDARSLRQNSFYWGVVLKEISQQAKLDGIGATPEGWNLYFKREHLGYRFRKTQLPGKKRPSVIKELISTKELKVKPMSVYLEKVIAQAVTDFGVMFSLQRWEDYRC